MKRVMVGVDSVTANVISFMRDNLDGPWDDATLLYAFQLARLADRVGDLDIQDHPWSRVDLLHRLIKLMNESETEWDVTFMRGALLKVFRAEGLVEPTQG